MVQEGKFSRYSVDLFYFSCILSFIPPVLALSLPLWAFRKILNIIFPIVCPFHGQLLSGLSSIYAQQCPYTRPDASVVTYVVVAGHVDFKEFRLHVMKKLCEFKRWRVYPEMQQELRTWCGFPVWKEIRNFRIDNQFRLLEGSELQQYLGSNRRIINDGNICQLAQSLSVVPYKKGTSPWEILVCHEENPLTVPAGPVSAIFFRFHQSLGDASSITQLVLEFFNRKDGTSIMEDNSSRDMFPKSKFHGVGTPLHASRWLLQFISDTWSFAKSLKCFLDWNQWHGVWTAQRSNYVYKNCVIPVEQIKTVCKMSQASYFKVIANAELAAIRRLFLIRGEKLPKTLCILTAMPTRTSERQLQNQVKFCLINIPIGATGVVPNLLDENIQGNFEGDNTFISLVTAVLGMLPRGILPRCLFRAGTGIATFVPRIKCSLQVLENDVTTFASITVFPSNAGFYASCTGYNGKNTICVGFSEDLAIVEKEREAFIKYLLDYFASHKKFLENSNRKGIK